MATAVEEMPTAPRPPPSSNPWSVVGTPASGERPQIPGPASLANQQAMTTSGIRSGMSLSGIRAWASGSFPAQKIDPALHRLWERRALIIGGIILGIIFVIAVIAALTN